jgi:serine kinase of HPr protein (carbohydrate metabolism regulator)
MILHAGLIAWRRAGAWRGALVMGDSGSGKSDLMLRALGQGFRLVADDRTLAWSSDGRAFGRAPDALEGLIELRGVGVTPEPALPLAEIALVVRCAAREDVERVPEPAFEAITGIQVPLVRLHAPDASAPAKLGRALNRLGRGRGPA